MVLLVSVSGILLTALLTLLIVSGWLPQGMNPIVTYVTYASIVLFALARLGGWLTRNRLQHEVDDENDRSREYTD